MVHLVSSNSFAFQKWSMFSEGGGKKKHHLSQFLPLFQTEELSIPLKRIEYTVFLSRGTFSKIIMKLTLKRNQGGDFFKRTFAHSFLEMFIS